MTVAQFDTSAAALVHSHPAPQLAHGELQAPTLLCCCCCCSTGNLHGLYNRYGMSNT